MSEDDAALHKDPTAKAKDATATQPPASNVPPEKEQKMPNEEVQAIIQSYRKEARVPDKSRVCRPSNLVRRRLTKANKRNSSVPRPRSNGWLTSI